MGSCWEAVSAWGGDSVLLHSSEHVLVTQCHQMSHAELAKPLHAQEQAVPRFKIMLVGLTVLPLLESKNEL